MRKLLYLLKSAAADSETLLPPRPDPEQEVTVILIQDGVARRHVPAGRVYALSDDVAARGIAPAFPTISYPDLVRMLFEADSVVAI